ncbi:MAG TPA: pirin [Bacteroidetes bacterium]|nr:pirin [Bacteroidota bacterium]
MDGLLIKPLDFPWVTYDPFLFCAFHHDKYPKGTPNLGPDPILLEGRRLGEDFNNQFGWNMYHGETVPGFPAHPHRGFETVTIAAKGLVDHSDSMGASGRFGNGDVQWMTAGSGVQHSEMFPLLNQKEPNELMLFQIWLNLPAASKMTKPHFAMLWHEAIPVVEVKSANGSSFIKLIAGKFEDYHAPAPAPNSWATDPENEVAIWLIDMEPGAELSLPVIHKDITRTLYYYEGNGISVNDGVVAGKQSIRMDADIQVNIKNGSFRSSFLYLQGKPISEPVAQYGPFVMNTQEEITHAFREYQQSQFGGWPWPKYDQVHPADKGRFAIHANGRTEIPG